MTIVEAFTFVLVIFGNGSTHAVYFKDAKACNDARVQTMTHQRVGICFPLKSAS